MTKGKKEEDADSYRHEDETRKNAVPVGLASYDTSKPKKYKYDSHLARALKGKAEYFLTCDDKLIRRATTLDINIKIINPLRFIEDMEVN